MKNKGMVILVVITILIIILTIIIAVMTSSKKEFKKPQFDKNAINILDTKIDGKLQYAEINVAEGYVVGICNNLILDEENNIKIYFRSLEENNVFVKLRIYEKDENVLSETGLIKPGEQIENIKVENLKQSKEVIIKIMSYDPKTYYSKGTVSLNSKIIIGDR